MAIFYVLPSRKLLARELSDWVAQQIPGVRLDTETAERLMAQIAEAVEADGLTYLIHREELPAGEPVSEALAAGFGAERDDIISEVNCR